MVNYSLTVTDTDNRISVQEQTESNLSVVDTSDNITVSEDSLPTIYLTIDITTLSNDTNPKLGGDLDLNSKGFKITGQNVAGSNGNIVYLSGANTWNLADASSENTSKSMIGVRINSTSVLTYGQYTTTGLVAGEIYYLSETSGEITNTYPTTTGTIVRILGYAISSTELMFDPDKTYIENS